MDRSNNNNKKKHHAAAGRGREPASGASSDSPEIAAAIARAKREWECTADALPHLVCLLDGGGRVVRVNRVVERWALGSVTEVIGRDVHTLLHPRCGEDSCGLKESLQRCWLELQTAALCEFELRDTVFERVLHVSLRPMLPSASATSSPGDTRAVLVVTDISTLRRAEEVLRDVNVQLESRVLARTHELADANRVLHEEIGRRESAEEALRVSLGELALLSEQLMNAQEVERKRISAELHDSVGQALTAIKYGLERADELARQARLEDPQPVLQRAVRGVQRAIEEIRSIAMNLRPPMLDDLGAASAVAWFCREFHENYPAIHLRTEIDLEDSDIPERLSTAVFRSTQELLNNVARHAQAHRAVVSLRRKSSLLTLEVRDDGIGLPQPGTSASLRLGHGIRNLRERAEMTGGQLNLISPPNGGGTLARIEWRLDPDQAIGEAVSC